MNYERCKCGKRERWTSYPGVMKCKACPECGMTLEENSADHKAPEPYLWGKPRWEIDSKTGERWQARICARCFTEERLP